VVGWNLFVDVICCSKIENEMSSGRGDGVLLSGHKTPHSVFAYITIGSANISNNVDDTLVEEEFYIPTTI
jgi:hypothetical protein